MNCSKCHSLVDEVTSILHYPLEWDLIEIICLWYASRGNADGWQRENCAGLVLVQLSESLAACVEQTADVKCSMRAEDFQILHSTLPQRRQTTRMKLLAFRREFAPTPPSMHSFRERFQWIPFAQKKRSLPQTWHGRWIYGAKECCECIKIPSASCFVRPQAVLKIYRTLFPVLNA